MTKLYTTRKSDKQDVNDVNLINVRDKTKLNFDAEKTRASVINYNKFSRNLHHTIPGPLKIPMAKFQN